MAEHSLADRLQRGALPLAAALECFADIAEALRDLHASGGRHGQVNAEHILLTPSGARLLPAEGAATESDHADDAMGLGAVIFQALTGSRPLPGAAAPWVPRVTGSRTNAAGIRASALRIARRAFTHPEEAARDWAKDSAELRVLAMLARQTRGSGQKPEEPAAPLPRPRPSGLVRPKGAPPKDVAPKRLPKAAGEAIEPAVSPDFLKEEDPVPRPAAPDPSLLPEHRLCPGCGSADIHSSKPRSAAEKLAVYALKLPLYRCHQCYHRWFLLFRLAIPCKVQKVHRRSFQ